MAEKTKTASSKAAQEFVTIKEIRDGIIILKDGSLRAILMASSLNFFLKSEDERTAILLQFQDFLNSLDFSIQIFIQSRRLEIRPYLATLDEQERNQMNTLMKVQTAEYIEFIRNFTDNTNIMTKTFFIVVPYTPAIIQSTGGNPITGLLNKKSMGVQPNNVFEEHRTQLEQRLSAVAGGLERTGIKIVQLGTEEVVELYYKLFNPGETGKPARVG
jgi:type IV secretory pathway VirB4 component